MLSGDTRPARGRFCGGCGSCALTCLRRSGRCRQARRRIFTPIFLAEPRGTSHNSQRTAQSRRFGSRATSDRRSGAAGFRGRFPAENLNISGLFCMPGIQPKRCG